MDLAPLIVQFYAAADPEARSQILEEIARADKSAYKPEVVGVLIEALDSEDPVVREWATVALRKLKGNREAIRALWDCYERDKRESIRCCAIIALGKMDEHLSADQLRSVYRERRSQADDLLLLFAIQVTSTATDPAVLQALIEMRDDEDKRTPPDPHFQNVIRAATLRCARYCLAANKITTSWLQERQERAVLDRLGETRIKRRIEEERANRDQSTFKVAGFSSETDSLLVPGRALADFRDEQYVQDLIEWKNVRIVETRSYVRDQYLARQTKKVVADACQVCGDFLAAPAQSRRFVHAHHVEPLSEGGADASKNLVVLCPSCHARLHADEIKLLRDTNDIPAFVSVQGEAARPLLASGALKDRDTIREQAAYAQIVCLLDRLSVQLVEAVVRLARERLARPSGQ